MKSNLSLPHHNTFKASQLPTIVTDSLTVLWGDWLKLRVRATQVVASGLISPVIYILA
ncbi:MAG: ABC transporter permease, partial [Moorea sp. SIO3I8]|nr:ABC transporter permease [Moorena sp. SIO3I8]